MEQLSKQQLVLLALLVSFVTSLATGIFTVSLMDQAPQGVVQTINQVVEHMVTPQNASVTQATQVPNEDKVPIATAQVSKSIVGLRSTNTDTIIGLGLVVSKNGIIIADKSTLSQLVGYEAVFADGSHVPMTLLQSQINGDVAFLGPTGAASTTFTAITFGKLPRIGQRALTLVRSDGRLRLSQGIISSTDVSSINPDGSQPARIDTDISENNVMLGSPIFNSEGEVMGMTTHAVSIDSPTAAFYPITQLKAAIPKIQ